MLLDGSVVAMILDGSVVAMILGGSVVGGVVGGSVGDMSFLLASFIVFSVPGSGTMAADQFVALKHLKI
jgi:hypothetical protein